MTIAPDRPTTEPLPERDDHLRSRIMRLRLLAAALAVLALGLGAALAVAATGDDAESTLPDDVAQVVDDFARAFEEQDDELMASIITDDFEATIDFYNPGTTEPAFTYGVTEQGLLRETRTQAWEHERFGDLLVAGDGPWVVAAHESWSDVSNREDGVRVFVIVEQDGVPKIDRYSFATVKVPVVPDFGG